MPTCEMCGREDRLVLVEVEGSRLQVCSNCGKHGKKIGRAPVKRPVHVSWPQKVIKPEPEEEVVDDFASKLRVAREKRGLKQEEFAQLLKEKVSLLQKWEAGTISPKLRIAKKLERMLGISFVKQVKDEEFKLSKSKSGEPTLGDFIKIRKRK